MKLRSLAFLLLLFLASAPLSLPAAEDPSGAPSKEIKQKSADKTQKGAEEEGDEALKTTYPSKVSFEKGKHPTIVFGRFGTMSFRTKFQFDWRGYDPDLTTRKGCGAQADSDGCLFDLNKFRIGIKGLFLKHFDYEVEREFKEGFLQFFPNPIVDPPKEPKDPWRDVYVNFHRLKFLQIMAGKFKIPFGLESLQGDSDKDFVYDARASAQLTPGRDIGIMFHGRLLNKGLGYYAGLFKHDGDGAEYKIVLDNPQPLGLETGYLSGQRTLVGRLVGTPLRLLPVPEVFKKVEFGTAFTDSPLPPGRKSLRGRTATKATWYDHIFVEGHRRRYSAEMNWAPGPFSLKGEFIAVTEQRLKQGLLGNDLPDAIARGWYLTGSWMVTGERRTAFKPKGPFRYYLVKGGPGAVELAVRWETLRFGSAEHPGVPTRGFRSPNILPNSDRAWTFGVNWYLNHWVKIQANFAHEHLEDPPRRLVLDPTGTTGPDPYWSRVIRIQFAL